MGFDNTLVSAYVGGAPDAAALRRLSDAVRVAAREQGPFRDEADGAAQQVVLVRIAAEPWITALRGGDEGEEMDDEAGSAWALALSKHSGLPVLAGTMHDNDLLGLILAVGGQEAGRLDISDLYFDGEMATEAQQDLSAWAAVVDGPAAVSRLEQVWADRENRTDTLAVICELLRLDTSGADGFAAARWFLTADSLDLPADQQPTAVEVLARIDAGPA